MNPLVKNISDKFEDMSKMSYSNMLEKLPYNIIDYYNIVETIFCEIGVDNIDKLKGISLVDKYSDVVHNYAGLFYKDNEVIVDKLMVVNWLYQILHLLQSELENGY